MKIQKACQTHIQKQFVLPTPVKDIPSHYFSGLPGEGKHKAKVLLLYSYTLVWWHFLSTCASVSIESRRKRRPPHVDRQ